MQDLDSAWEQKVRPLVVNLSAKGLIIRDNLKEIFEVGVGHSRDIWGQKVITAQQCK